MAQDGSHGHQDTASSDEHSLVPPTTTTFVLDPTENDNGRGSRIGSPVGMDANKGKNVVVPKNAIIEGGEHGSDSSDKANTSRSEGKNSAEAAIADADAAADDGLTAKGKNSLAADANYGELKAQLIVERERRRRMEELFSTQRELMPHVPKKVDKATLVGAGIDFIRSLQNTKAADDQMLARQAVVASSMSSMPRTAHGMAVTSDVWDPLPPPQKPASASAAAAAGAEPIEFQTWSAPNVVLSVLPNDEAVINICAPERPHMLTLLMSVLTKYNIEVTSMQVVLADTTDEITINARVNGAIGQNPSAEDIYKLAVSEIVVRLSS